MIKLVSLMLRKEGMSRAEFARWAVEEHAPIGRRMPKIRAYRISVVRPDQPETPFDGVFELYFDTMEDLQAALDSPVGTEAREDAMAHAATRVHLRTEEHIVIAGA